MHETPPSAHNAGMNLPSHYRVDPRTGPQRERRVRDDLAGIGIAYMHGFLHDDRDGQRAALDAFGDDPQRAGIESALLSAMRLVARRAARVWADRHDEPCNAAGLMQHIALGTWSDEAAPDAVVLLAEALIDGFAHTAATVVTIPRGVSPQLNPSLIRDLLHWIESRTERSKEDLLNDLRRDLAATVLETG